MGDALGDALGDGHAHVQHGVIWELGVLHGVAQVTELTKGEAAVEDDVMLEMHRVGINVHRHKLVRRPAFVLQVNAFRVPFNRQLASNLGQQLIALRVTPQDEVEVF